VRILTLSLLFAVLVVPDAAAGPTHWSLRPRACPEVPRFADPADRAWCRTPLDAFVLDRLLKAGLRPAPEADRRTLIRRLSFDLVGLPPSPEEIDAFVSDRAPDAYERLVDRLLASPHHGERWGRHWLDVVRYAETDGFEYNRYRPGAWRYRDYVIRSFNEDKPFDRFVTEQLAGDEIDPQSPEMQVAVGFHRLGPVRRNAGNALVAFSRQEVLNEMTDSLGAVFLGLTMGCARCHDHKFDAVPQADYYRLQAYLAATHEQDLVLAAPAEEAAWKARNDRLMKEIKEVKLSLAGKQGEEKQRIEVRQRELERSLPPPLPTISTVRHDVKTMTPVHVLKRGDFEQKGQRVGPRPPSALVPSDLAELPSDAQSPRTALARWVVGPENPLTARVIVNRVWQHHFGTGLVATPNDFGVNGTRPSHPELLDYLADEFVAGGWHLKSLHRAIVLSATYRQASVIPQSAIRSPQSMDPEDRLLWRFPRRRLSAEEVRDAMLSASGALNRRAGGPSVVLPVEPDLVRLLYDPAQWVATPNEREHDRRSVYLFAKRNLRLPFAEAFDQPDAQTSCPRREQSTHALQALELLNGATSNRLAAVFARRLENEAGTDRDGIIRLAFLLAAGREPTARERELSRKFLETQSLREFALAVFNLNAFLYVD
jgi:hypothetical protein